MEITRHVVSEPYANMQGATIKNIRRGKGARSVYVYAELRSATDELLISATLEYITDQLLEHLPNV